MYQPPEKDIDHDGEPEADKPTCSESGKRGFEGRTHKQGLQDGRSKCPGSGSEAQEVRDRNDEPQDGEERFFWGRKGNTQPYTETYFAATGTWHKDAA